MPLIPRATHKACKAKVSSSLTAWEITCCRKRWPTLGPGKTKPLLVTLINQLLMVAADVDNDLFDNENSDSSDGSAIDNLTYRITALYSGRDAVLGASAGLKHFGTRRLGRSGLALESPPLVSGPPETDNK